MTTLRTSAFLLADQWHIRPLRYQIEGNGKSVTVGPKVMDVLVYLAEHAGEVVTREALMAAIWPDTYVVEESLTRCISELRKVFGDTWQDPHIIETIRNVGYRLMVPVTPVDALSSPVPSPPTTLSPLRWAAATIGGILALVLFGYALLDTPSEIAPPWQPTPFTHFPGVEQDAAFAPNGQQVAFVWDGGQPGQAHLYLQALDQTIPTQLTTGRATDRHPAWSPDAQEIAFLRDEAGVCQVLVTSVVHQRIRSLGTCTGNRTPDLAWSPDGQWLAFSTYVPPHGPSRIVLLDAKSGAQKILTAPPISPYGDYLPAFSPDGQWVAFVRAAYEEASDVYVVAVGGGEAQRLTQQRHLIRGLTWHPDSQNLLFATNYTGRFGLWQVSLDGSPPTWVAEDTEDILAPHLDATGSNLLFERFTTEPNLWHMPLDKNAARAMPVVTSGRWDVAPHVGPDGRLAFASNRSGAWAIWVAEADGSNPKPVTTLSRSIVGAPRWSPDGTRIAFDARPERHTDIQVVHLANGTITRLTSLPADDWTPTWSRDGKYVYFASDRSGAWQIWRVAATGGNPEPITRDGGMFAQESTDGQHLFFARNDTAGVWQQPVAGGPAQRLFGALEDFDWGNWAVTETAIFFIRRTDHAALIAQYDLASNTQIDLLDTGRPTPWQLPWSAPAFSVSPDGKHAYFTQIDRRESDLWRVAWR